jgi:hypothetical protein
VFTSLGRLALGCTLLATAHKDLLQLAPLIDVRACEALATRKLGLKKNVALLRCAERVSEELFRIDGSRSCRSQRWSMHLPRFSARLCYLLSDDFFVVEMLDLTPSKAAVLGSFDAEHSYDKAEWRVEFTRLTCSFLLHEFLGVDNKFQSQIGFLSQCLREPHPPEALRPSMPNGRPQALASLLSLLCESAIRAMAINKDLALVLETEGVPKTCVPRISYRLGPAKAIRKNHRALVTHIQTASHSICEGK